MVLNHNLIFMLYKNNKYRFLVQLTIIFLFLPIKAQVKTENVKGDNHSLWISSIVFNNNKSQFLTASGDSTAKIWDSKSGKVLNTFRGHNGGVVSAEFNAASSQIVTASQDNTARIWDASTGELLHILYGHTESVVSAQFNATGNKIVTASHDGTAAVWDASTGMRMQQFSDQNVKYNSWMYFAKFNASGSQILTISGDRKARVWETKTGKLIYVIESIEDLYLQNKSYTDFSSSDLVIIKKPKKTDSLEIRKFVNSAGVVVDTFVQYSIIIQIRNSESGKLIQNLEYLVDGTNSDFGDFFGDAIERKNYYDFPPDPISLFYDIEFNQSDNQIIISRSVMLEILDVETGNVLKSIKYAAPERLVHAVYHPNEKEILTLSEINGHAQISIFDANTFKIKRSFKNKNINGFRMEIIDCYGEGNDILLVFGNHGDDSGSVDIIDLQSGNILKSFHLISRRY